MAFAAAIAAIAVLGLGHASGPAGADTVAYAAPDGQIWLKDPVSGRNAPVTSDGSAASPYRSPSQTGDGRIVAVRGSQAVFINPANGAVSRRWDLARIEAGRFLVKGTASADGNRFAYEWSGVGCPSQACVAITIGGPVDTGGEGLAYPQQAGGSLFTVVSDQGSDGYITSGFGFEPLGLGGPLGGGTGRLAELDRSAAGYTMAVWDELEGAEPGTRRLELSSPEAGLGEKLICGATVPASASRFALSSDGSWLAWQDGASVLAAEVEPTEGADGPDCGLVPLTVAAAGREPAWGSARFPSVPPAPGGPGGPDGDEQPAAPSNSGPRKGATVQGQLTLQRALKRGLPIRVKCPRACRVRLAAFVSGRIAARYGLGEGRTVVGGGRSLKYRRGVRTVRIKFTPKAKRKLAAARALPLAIRATLSTRKAQSTTVISLRTTLRQRG